MIEPLSFRQSYRYRCDTDSVGVWLASNHIGGCYRGPRYHHQYRAASSNMRWDAQHVRVPWSSRHMVVLRSEYITIKWVDYPVRCTH
jgi:hypothetical protein